MSDDAAVVSRKVHFFRIEHFAEIKVALPGAFQRIANLPFNDGGRYQNDVSASFK